MERIDQSLMELKTIDSQIETLTKQKEDLRKEVFGIIENEGLTDGYKNDFATVSYVERKSVKIEDKESLLKELQKEKIVKYFEKIPAHVELTKEFEKDVKEGLYTHPTVKVETSNNLSLRFNK